MELLASLFVGKPLNILAVAGIFLAGSLPAVSAAIGGSQNRRPILVAAAAWGLYAAWEWLSLVRTPEANIRADLLVIWPILAILSCWPIMRSFTRSHS